MRDSGVKVILGLRADGNSAKNARLDGFEVLSVSEAAKKADIIHILIPDQHQRSVYEKDIKPAMTPGKSLMFSHGFNIRFKLIAPRKAST